MGAAKNTTPRVPDSHTRKPWRKTPLVESANLSKAAGWYVTSPQPLSSPISPPSRSLSRRSRIFLKLENLQPSGSFKSRGLGNLVLQSMERANDPEKVHFYASSGGNAGLGCVYGANFVGRPSTVVVPMTTKPHMIAKIKAAGATEVVQYGASIAEADVYMREVVMEKAYARGEEPIYVSPFDHPDIWDGHSTMIDEMREQFEELGEDPPEYIVCSCGGGGLFIGVMQGIENQGNAWRDTRVLTVNTKGADALPVSLEKGVNVAIPKITSIATSLGCAKAADRAFELAQEGHQTGRVKSVVLSDAEAAMGCWRFAEDERILVEAACGVNVALCYGNRLKKALGRPVCPEEKFVLVICGGSNVSTAMIEDWKQQYGDLDAGKTNGAVKMNGCVPEVPSAVLAPNGRWLAMQ